MTKEELRLNQLEEEVRRLKNITPLPSTATLSDIIIKINEIVKSMKRK